ncbi:MAG: hypothetical protein HQL15_10140 [Candidatus Omnitrophica bacterium]|nr:hypothetical protein [Candidatus Omnitrophota bacterium]
MFKKYLKVASTKKDRERIKQIHILSKNELKRFNRSLIERGDPRQCPKHQDEYHPLGYHCTIPSTLFLQENVETKVKLSIHYVYAVRAQFAKQQNPLSFKEEEDNRKRFGKVVLPPLSPNQVAATAYEYSKECIEKKKDRFLVRLYAELWDVGKEGGCKRKQLDLFQAIPPFIYESKYEKHAVGQHGGIHEYFHDLLWSEICGDEEKILMSKKDYNLALTRTCELIRDLRNKKVLFAQDFALIRKIDAGIPKRINPFVDFSWAFFDSLLDYLHKKKLLKRCTICRKVISYEFQTDECGSKCIKRRKYIQDQEKYGSVRLATKRKKMTVDRLENNNGPKKITIKEINALVGLGLE